MATNFEIIDEACEAIGFEYDGSNLKTFQEWKKIGYSVQKGEKAFLKVELWKPFDKKIFDENKKPVIDEKTGKQKVEKRFMLRPASLFTIEQVEKISRKKTA